MGSALERGERTGSLGAATPLSTKQSWIHLAVLGGDGWKAAAVAQLLGKPRSFEVCDAPHAKVSMCGLVGSRIVVSDLTDAACLANCRASLGYASM